MIDSTGTPFGEIFIVLTEHEQPGLRVLASYAGRDIRGNAQFGCSVVYDSVTRDASTYTSILMGLSPWPNLGADTILIVRNRPNSEPSACPSGFVLWARQTGETISVNRT